MVEIEKERENELYSVCMNCLCTLHTFTVDILDDKVLKEDRLFDGCDELTLPSCDQQHV